MTLWVTDAPVPDSTPPATRTRDAFVIAVLGLLFYGLNVDFWLYGDSALYADYSLRREFTEVTLHLGYYWLVIAAQATFGALLRIPIQETMGWLNVAFGAGGLCVAYFLALELFGERRLALITVAILAISGRMFTNATSSEVYATQLFFVLLSFLLFTRERIYGAAAAAAAAMLISPLSLFAFLYFPVSDYQRTGRIRWGVLAKLALVSFLLYLPYLAVYGDDLLWGRRGLLKINAVARTDPNTALWNFPRYQFKAFTLMLVLLPSALLAWRTNRRYIVLAAAVAIPHIFIILKLTGEDNVFILNTDFFAAGLLALGWRELSRKKITGWIGPATYAGHAALLIAAGWVFAFNNHRDYPEELRGTYEQHIRNRNVAVITDWGTAMAFVLYSRDSAATSLVDEQLFQRVFDVDNAYQSDSIVRVADALYLIDRWNPTPLRRLLSSEESLRKQSQQNSVRLLAERRLNLTCTLLSERTNRLYKCARNAPGTGAASPPRLPDTGQPRL